MSMDIEERKIGRDFYAGFGLKKKAAAIVKATERDERAKKEVLQALPGVFSMILEAGESSVHLIKEGNALRIMEKSEKSDVLLSIAFEDVGGEREIFSGKTTLSKLFSEGRLSYKGRTSFFAALMRIDAVSDDILLSEKKKTELYGKKR